MKPPTRINSSHRETNYKKEAAMRKREHFIGLWLDGAEYERLQKQCVLSGLSTSVLIRHSINGREHHEAARLGVCPPLGKNFTPPSFVRQGQGKPRRPFHGRRRP